MAKEVNRKVIQTAWFTAYLRSFSDIPYAKEIFEEFDKLEYYHDISNTLRSPELAPELEARQKLIDKILVDSEIDQILEIASGMSSRGLSMVKGEKVYVEMDLPEIIIQKIKILNKIAKNPLDKLHLEQGNALDLRDLQRATIYFTHSKPIAIVNEGLMRYLDFDYKAVYIRNVHKILEGFGGIWITSDVSTLDAIENQNKVSGGQADKLNRVTDTSAQQNSFKSLADAEEFFGKFGFDVEIHKFSEVRDLLVSPERLKISKTKVDKILKSWVVFVMRLK